LHKRYISCGRHRHRWQGNAELGKFRIDTHENSYNLLLKNG
jgi:hypothetical protein